MTIPVNKTAGSIVTAQDYNDLAGHINKIFGDAYVNSQPSTDPDTIANMKYGWGQSMIPLVHGKGPSADIITAAQWNELADRLQISVINTNDALIPITRFKVGDESLNDSVKTNRLYAGQFNDLLSLTNTADENKNNLNPAEALVATASVDTRTANWKTKIQSTVKFDFDSFDNACNWLAAHNLGIARQFYRAWRAS